MEVLGWVDCYLLVDFNTDSALGDVPDPTGTSVIELVGHALVDRAVNLDIDIVSDFEDPEVGGEMGRTLLPEGTSKEIPGSRSQTVPSRHFFWFSECVKKG